MLVVTRGESIATSHPPPTNYIHYHPLYLMSNYIVLITYWIVVSRYEGLSTPVVLVEGLAMLGRCTMLVTGQRSIVWFMRVVGRMTGKSTLSVHSRCLALVCYN